MQHIAVMTSGGDAPGMNAAIRAVVRTGLDNGWGVIGIYNGYTGLIAGDLVPMGARDVGGIIQLGGTILGSTRCLEFKTEEGRMQALRTLHQNDVEALIVIGGNGSQSGAYALSQRGSTLSVLHQRSTTIFTDQRSRSVLTLPLTLRWRLSIVLKSQPRLTIVRFWLRSWDVIAATLP